MTRQQNIERVEEIIKKEIKEWFPNTEWYNKLPELVIKSMAEAIYDDIRVKG